MSLTTGSRRASQFAALLDSPHRSDDPALAPYVALAGALSALPVSSGPSPDFRAALRQRLVAVATVQPAGQPEDAATRLRGAAGTWKMQRRVAVLAGGAAAVTAIAGVGVGASRSLPGDPFYGVKRATERVQLATTTGQEARGKRHLEFARTRLDEVEALIGRNSALTAFLPGTAGALGPMTDEAKASTIVSTLQDMDAETRAGAEDLLAAYRDSGTDEPLQALGSFTTSQFGALRADLPALPSGAQERARRSLSLLTVVADQTRSVARSNAPTPGEGGGGTPTTAPGGKKSGAPQPHHSSAAPHSTPRSGGGSSSEEPGGSRSTTPLPGVPTQAPTTVPTIPSLPTVLPLPTSIPTSLPSLPLLPEAPTLGH